MKLRKVPPVYIKKTIVDGKEISFYTSDEKIEYSKEPILSGLEAYVAMLRFLDKYFKDNYQETVGECLTRMSFMNDDTHYAECWELWEKIVNEILEKKNKK